ncbi:hypothetical protein NDU88_003599 [Pleurodeles waltl]|uniref:Uncharacterized protein n=1 Tax=Pleurodeles waltl TaxID=8319 RepID=A0AAV7SGF1_PLEWA|nr:hypothetical protein NDU88_003599 [Pleurodeles waltl]
MHHRRPREEVLSQAVSISESWAGGRAPDLNSEVQPWALFLPPVPASIDHMDSISRALGVMQAFLGQTVCLTLSRPCGDQFQLGSSSALSIDGGSECGEMSPGKSSGKASGKPIRISEAVSQPRLMSSSAIPLDSSSTDAPVNSHPDTAMERILQDISAVGRPPRSNGL